MSNLHEQNDQEKVKNTHNEKPKENPLLKKDENKEKPKLSDKKNGDKLSKGSSSSGMKNNFSKAQNMASMSESSDIDDVASDLSKKTSDVAKGAASGLKRVGQNAKNAALNFKKQMKKNKQRMKKIAKTIQMLKAIVVKLAMAVVHLIMMLWPLFLTLIITIIISGLVFKFMDNASIKGNQFVETETVSEYNNVDYDDNGKLEITEVTMANKLVRAFYTYFSEKSIWVMTDGKYYKADGSVEDGGISTNGDMVQYRSEEYNDLFKDPNDPDAEVVGDKYNRESQFYINPNALYVLDKYLHDGQFRFPEQIVKHVAIQENTHQGDSSGEGVFVGNGNEEICWNYYRSVGFTEAQTAGLLGNIFAESSFDTSASNGTHFGIHQWGAGRFIALKERAATKGKDWTDLSIQLEHAYSELSGPYKSTLESNGWNNANLTATGAADLIRLHYEVCGEQGAEVRREAAQRYYDKFKGTSANTSTNDNDDENKNDKDSESTASGAYTGWKQTDPRWGNMTLPGGGTVHDIGCYATSSCVLAAYAGATSKDESKFNPKIGIPQLNYAGDALYMGSISNLGDGSLTYVETVSCSSLSSAVKMVKDNVDKGYFYIVRIGNPNTHFMPILGVTDNDLIVNDVGRASYSSPTNLSEILSVDGRPITEMRVYKSSKTTMKDCGNVSYEGGSSGSLSNVPYELAQLTDDKRDLIAESTKYEETVVDEPVYKKKTETETRYFDAVAGTTTEKLPKEIEIEKGGTKETTTSYQDVKIPLDDAQYSDPTTGLVHASYEVTITSYEQIGTKKKTYWTPTDEKEKGVWDYGFGSVVSYKKYEEKQESRGNITLFDVWAPNEKYTEGGKTITGKVIQMTAEDFNARKDAENLECVFDLSKQYTWDESSSSSYMIDWAITPAGTITNGIDYTWQDTGTASRRSDNEVVNKTYTRKVRYKEERSVIIPAHDKVENVVIKDIDGEEKETTTLYNNTDSEMKKIYDCLVEKEESYNAELKGTVEGTIYKIEPRYSNDNVDTSGITGIRYYEDYLYNYDGYVPISVQGKFDFDEIKSRTGQNKKDLLKVLETQSFTDTESETEFFDADGKYVGIGSIQAKYERGADFGEMDPGHHETDGKTPGWGVSNMTPEECRNFLNWVKEKDPDFYNKYFGGVTIDTNNWQSGPFVDAWEKCGKEQKEQFTLYQISHEWKTLVCWVLENKKITQDPVLSQIDFNRSFILQELVYDVACAAPVMAVEVFTSCGITTTDSDGDIIKKVGTYLSSPSVYQKWYNSMFWNGVVNRWSPDKSESQTSVMIKYIDENGEGTPYEWDADEEMFVGGGGNSLASSDNKTTSMIKKMWNSIKKAFSNINDFLSDILFGQEYHDVLKDKYWTKMTGAALQDDQADWVLSAMFAYNDQEEVTSYTVDDEYFKLMYEQMFSSQINNNGGSGSGVKNIYFAGKGTNPLSEDKDATITTKYSKKDNPVLILSTKSGTKIKAVAEGKVIKKGYDAEYGGNYIVIQHSKCVSIYGNMGDIDVQDHAKIKEGQVIGKTKSNFYFALRTKIHGSYINPTELFTSSSSSNNSTEAPADATDVVKRAYGKLGCAYVWCAVGPNTFDCSGLVSYCLTGKYERLGNTTTFAAWPKVTNPQPGDICLNSHHTGVYIGDGKMIHAPQEGDVVKISKVHSDMWYVRYPGK